MTWCQTRVHTDPRCVACVGSSAPIRIVDIHTCRLARFDAIPRGAVRRLTTPCFPKCGVCSACHTRSPGMPVRLTASVRHPANLLNSSARDAIARRYKPIVAIWPAHNSETQAHCQDRLTLVKHGGPRQFDQTNAQENNTRPCMRSQAVQGGFSVLDDEQSLSESQE